MQEENSKISIQEIPVENISPNPYQPRREFNELNLSSLAESIRQYGVMQPIVVTKKTDGHFELISGERRLRASKIAGKITIPSIVRNQKHSNEEKFELAIIENLQREDLNPIDKAKSFKKLVEEFNLTHSEIAQKMGKSREYISNSLRILMLPDNILDSIVMEEISEGHSRPLLMLKDRPFEQGELFKKIIQNKLTVRAAEKIARSIAVEKVRKPDNELDSDLKKMETKLAEKLGTKVSIDKKTSGEGGKLTIEYFSREDLEKIINLVKGKGLSSSPVLKLEKEDEQNSNFAIEKFEDNFTTQKIGEESLELFSKQEPVIFGEEINELSSNLENIKEEEYGNKINTDKLISEENKKEDGVGGFNITSFDKNIYVESDVSAEKHNNENNKEKIMEESFDLEKKEVVSQDEDKSVSLEQEKKMYGNTFSDFGEISNFNIPIKEKNISEPNIQVEKEINLVKEIEEKEEIQDIKKNDNKKSEAQKRIDNILSGASTVKEEYGMDEREEKKGFPQDIKKKEVGIEDSPVYKQFLESKKRIEEEKENMYKEKNISNNEAENSNQNIFGKLSENSSDFISSGGGIEKKSEMIRESSIAMNQINDNIKKKEQVEDIFNGDDFIPKKENNEKGNNSDKDNIEFSL